MKKTYVSITTVILASAMLAGCGQTQTVKLRDLSESSSSAVEDTGSEVKDGSESSGVSDRDSTGSADQNSSGSEDNGSAGQAGSILDGLFSSGTKMSKLSLSTDSSIFSAVPDEDALAGKYSYYITTLTDDTYEGYFERNQFNLSADGTVSSRIEAEGNTSDSDDAYITELDDLSCLFENEDFWSIYDYTYDSEGRLSQTLIYDRFISHTDPAYITSYQYSDDGSVTSSRVYYDEPDSEDAYVETIYYDEQGNPLTSENGYPVSYTYDSEGNIASLTKTYDNMDPDVYQYTYDNGQVVSQICNFTDYEGNPHSIAVTYTYENGNLTHVNRSCDGGNEFAIMEYTYGDDGLLIQGSDLLNGSTITYEYF